MRRIILKLKTRLQDYLQVCLKSTEKLGEVWGRFRFGKVRFGADSMLYFARRMRPELRSFLAGPPLESR